MLSIPHRGKESANAMLPLIGAFMTKALLFWSLLTGALLSGNTQMFSNLNITRVEGKQVVKCIVSMFLYVDLRISSKSICNQHGKSINV